jgi:hypothetical protein
MPTFNELIDKAARESSKEKERTLILEIHIRTFGKEYQLWKLARTIYRHFQTDHGKGVITFHNSGGEEITDAYH